LATRAAAEAGFLAGAFSGAAFLAAGATFLAGAAFLAAGAAFLDAGAALVDEAADFFAGDVAFLAAGAAFFTGDVAFLVAVAAFFTTGAAFFLVRAGRLFAVATTRAAFDLFPEREDEVARDAGGRLAWEPLLAGVIVPSFGPRVVAAYPYNDLALASG
jgi:hypothetical protein